jgi:TPR repeat protein
MYHEGIQVEKDHEKALELYLKSAQSGNAGAQFGLANMYFKGEGGERDFGSAYVFFSLAAAQEYPKAAKMREKTAKMLTAEQLAEAKELVAIALGNQ